MTRRHPPEDDEPDNAGPLFAPHSIPRLTGWAHNHGLATKATLFDGETFDASLDHKRLGAQMGAVRALMGDGAWRTLREISLALGEPEASISARLRDLRKVKFGALTVELRRRGEPAEGLFEYRVSS